VLKLRHAVEIDKERSPHLNDGVIARQQTDKVGEPWAMAMLRSFPVSVTRDSNTWC
jgi:hypothetical protein